MGVKLFISYSHKDNNYFDEFVSHLSPLRRNEKVDDWYDRKINAGENIDSSVMSELEASDIVVHLISSNFIHSNYCYEKEAMKAKEMNDRGKAKLIPIIVHPCVWKELDVFSKVVAIPTDGKAISTWKNEHSAWTDVVENLLKVIDEILKDRDENKSLIENDGNNTSQPDIEIQILSDNFQIWLNDLEIQIIHNEQSSICLDDVFIYPDLKVEDDKIDTLSEFISAKKIINLSKDCVIFGEEQSGKTALAKTLCKEFMLSGKIPVYLNGNFIYNSKTESIIKKALKEQYHNGEGLFEKYKLVIIVDDFHALTLRKEYKEKLVNEITAKSEMVILLADDSLQMNLFDDELESLEGFKSFEIMPFGNVKRQELIERWVSIGQVECISDEELYKRSDEIKIHIDNIVGKNLVPSKPIYLLTILQSIESATPTKLDQTSYGYCYEYLILSTLEKAKVKAQDIPKHINYLTEFSYFIFNNNLFGLQSDWLEKFGKMYNEKYVGADHEFLYKNLIDVKLLQNTPDGISFKYKYIYYFYVAKYLAENIRDKDIRHQISSLLENLHKEECANIVLFINHHTKDTFVLDEIMLNMMALFEGVEPATLEPTQLEFMNEILKSIPKLVMDNKNVSDKRKEHHQKEEDYKQSEKKSELEVSELNPDDKIAQMFRTIKSIEIVGQILRNRISDMPKEPLLNLTKDAYDAGLRFLGDYLSLSDSLKGETIEFIEKTILSDPNANTLEVEKDAKRNFLMMTLGVTYSVIRRMSYSLGSKEALPIYREIEKNNPTPAIQNINFGIELNYGKRLDYEYIRDTNKKLEGNPIMQRMLSESVLQYLYMYPVPYKVKQQISDELKIPLKTQNAIQLKRQSKK